MRQISLILVLVCAAALPAGAQTRGAFLAGPVMAQVERVLDGDTLAVRVQVWLGQELRVLVRIRGIDAPEMRGACAQERGRARAAADHLSRQVASGQVVLTNIAGGKYYGRVLADVARLDGGQVGAALLDAGLVRNYGGRKRESWCGGHKEAG